MTDRNHMKDFSMLTVFDVVVPALWHFLFLCYGEVECHGGP